MAAATENRKRKRRTFTMDDESYERLTPNPPMDTD